MSYEAILYDKAGMALSDVRAIFDRGWKLNSYEECTFQISAIANQSKLTDFAIGNYLVITDEHLDIWGGYIDTPQPWSSDGVLTLNAYSGERIFEKRPANAEQVLKGTAGVVYRQIIEAMNACIPIQTLMRAGVIYAGGTSRQETISLKKLYDDVLRISSRSGNDWYVEPVVRNGILHFEGHWYESRGLVKDFALEEGVNCEVKQNFVEYQGEIWNYILAYGNGLTWADRPKVVAFDQESMDKYDTRVYALPVDATDITTVQASAEAFLNFHKQPRRTFNLTVGGSRVRQDEAMLAKRALRIGDTVKFLAHSYYEVDKRGVDTWVRVTGLTHRGKTDLLDVTANEVMQ